MFFASSRSRFKSKPPRILVYCLEFVCLVVLLTLLIAQLRAVELPAASRNVPRQQQPEIFIDQNRDNATSSIDRDDRISTYDEESAAVVQPQSKRQPDELAIRNASTSKQNDPIPLDSQAAVNGTSYQASVRLDGGDDLFVSPATAQTVQAAPQDDAQQVVGNDEPRLPMEPQAGQLPSLAEMTAAGTAAGMLIHDLMAQANMMYDKPASSSVDEVADSEREQIQPETMPFSGDAELAAQMQQMAANDQDGQEQPLMQQEQSALNDGDEDSKQQVPMLSRAEAVNRINAAQTAIADSGSGSEPTSEDASPDSIESLMGTDLNDADEASQEQSELDEQQPQQLADSNLVNSNEALAGQLGLQPQYAMERASKDDDDDDDDSNESESPQAIDAQDSQLRDNHYGAPAPVPVLLSTRYEQPGEPLASPKFVSEMEHNLVAPMRESLVDLNAAAGHYHAKKEKVKKVKKKIVIKKKKKKKKKKYKKIKIVEIKKKKKPKKYHRHHHDHGKYYMYAKVPKKKAWEFGFKKGNKKHWIERHEKGYKNKFKTKVKWYDKKSKGKGLHIWDYNHYDKKKKKHH